MAMRYNVGNLHYGPDGSAIVRVVSEEVPFTSARPVEPTLEDVYLYLFQESSHDADDVRKGAARNARRRQDGRRVQKGDRRA